MSKLSTFRAVYCSGLFIEQQDIVTQLSLLFEKIKFHNNFSFVREFAKKYEFITNPLEVVESESIRNTSISIESEKEGFEPFSGLRERQRKTCESYLLYCTYFAERYRELFPDVFETEMFPAGVPPKLKAHHIESEGPSHHFRVSFPSITLSVGDTDGVSSSLEMGYFPVVGKTRVRDVSNAKIDSHSAKQLAMLLGMTSIDMILPRTKQVDSQTILEARYRLRDHLPQFWAAMFRLSTDLKTSLKEGLSEEELKKECIQLVDSTIRPAAIELKKKLEQERKNWFYRILEPIGRGVRLLVGVPGMSQQELITSAMILSTDVTMTSADQMRKIEALKGQAGLTFLIEAEKVLK